MQKRKRSSSRIVGSSRRRLPKNKKNFCKTCRKEFSLKELHRHPTGGWICSPCLTKYLCRGI